MMELDKRKGRTLTSKIVSKRMGTNEKTIIIIIRQPMMRKTMMLLKMMQSKRYGNNKIIG